MRRRCKRKILLTIIIIVLTSGFFLSNILTIDYLHVMHLYLYKANEFLLPYFHEANTEFPDIDYNFNLNSTKNLSTVNFLCMIPEIKYDNKLAMKYLNADFQALKNTFTQCDNVNNEIDLVFVNDHTLFDVKTKKLNETLLEILKMQNLIKNEPSEYKYMEFYSLKLNTKGFYDKLGQSEDYIQCYAQRFDKVLNESESKERVVMIDEKREFEKKYDFTLYFDTYGFYYVVCFKRLGFRNYEFVYNIFPRNMSILIENRKIYRKHEIDKFNLLKEEPEEIKFLNVSKVDAEVQVTKKMNVLILGFDSVSFNHFKRIFPETYDYLSNRLENTVIYDSFSSVGSNTFPNILALMAGIVETGVDVVNVKSERILYENIDGTFFDYLPFIWYEFEKLGYLTFYQEDQPPWAIFNYLKDGYRFKPTAFYGRPYWLKYYETRSGGFSMCHQGRPTFKTYFNLIESFLNQMNKEQNRQTPYFAFNFLSEYTHDFLASPPQLDKYTAEVLERLEDKGYFDNTLLILTSDHGNRLQSFAYGTEIGKIEKFLPFFSIRLPKQLWNTSLDKNLKSNRNKLVGFYDIYQTIRQFLHLNSNFKKPLDRSQYSVNSRTTRYLRGISLFESIPMNRSCGDTLIPEEVCRCFKQYTITEEIFQKETSQTFSDAVTLILNNVKKFTENLRDRCIEFTEDKIKSVKLLNIYNLVLYKFVVIFQPGDAWFEASIKTTKNEKNPITIHGGINRISAYGNQSKCVDSSF